MNIYAYRIFICKLLIISCYLLFHEYITSQTSLFLPSIDV